MGRTGASWRWRWGLPSPKFALQGKRTDPGLRGRRPSPAQLIHRLRPSDKISQHTIFGCMLLAYVSNCSRFREA
jgi:hypothetical protein